jgi:carbon-monoxide dehydrogenase medium subunit
MIAAGAICVIAGPYGERELPVESFVTGVGTNALEPGELLLGIRLPNPGPRSGEAYLRLIPRTEMDIAVAGCGVRLELDGDGVCTAARVAIGAVAPTAILVPGAADALLGTRVDDAALAAAGAACSEASSPISDKRGTIDYRRKVVGVLCRRAGAIARDRALGV